MLFGNDTKALLILLVAIALAIVSIIFYNWKKKDKRLKSAARSWELGIFILPFTLSGADFFLISLYSILTKNTVSNLILSVTVMVIFLLCLVWAFLVIKRKLPRLSLAKGFLGFHQMQFKKLLSSVSLFHSRPARMIYVLFLDLFFLAVIAISSRFANNLIYHISSFELDAMQSASQPDFALIGEYVVKSSLVTICLFLFLALAYFIIKSWTWSVLRDEKHKLRFCRKFSLYQFLWCLVWSILIILSFAIFKKGLGYVIVIVGYLLFFYLTSIMPAVFNIKLNLWQNFKRIISFGIKRFYVFIILLCWVFLIYYFLTISFVLLNLPQNNYMLLFDLLIILLIYQVIRSWIILLIKDENIKKENV